MTTSDTATPPAKAGGDEDERHRLTALEGLAALSLDALSSVAYGPEAILVVLMAAGAAALKYTMPITIAIVVLLAVLVIIPTVAFIAAIAAVIVAGLFRSHPVVAPIHTLPQATDTVGLLLILKAFASGCSALTGVEAIANAVPSFRQPRVKRAQHTEVGLGVILGVMLLGLAELIRKFNVVPGGHITVLAQVTRAGLGRGAIFYAIQIITLILLALAANTSFGGLPVLASLLAEDNFLPHLFYLKAERQVHRYGVVVLAAFAAVLLIVSRGDTQALVPLFAIGVFVGFTLSQVGMVRHWSGQRGDGWWWRATIVVPVSGLSRLTAESITAALALGDQVTAVYVCYGDEEDEQTRRFQQAWEQWDHKVPLVTLYSPHRSLGPPIVDYLHQLEQRGDGRRLVVLISELEPRRAWQWILHNQRGVVLDRAIRNGTDNVVICRMRFRPTTWSAN